MMMEEFDGDHNVVLVGVAECLPWKWKKWKECVRNPKKKKKKKLRKRGEDRYRESRK